MIKFEKSEPWIENDEEDGPCKYFHIMSCNKGEFADRTGEFAENINRYVNKFAEKEPK